MFFREFFVRIFSQSVFFAREFSLLSACFLFFGKGSTFCDWCFFFKVFFSMVLYFSTRVVFFGGFSVRLLKSVFLPCFYHGSCVSLLQGFFVFVCFCNVFGDLFLQVLFLAMGFVFFARSFVFLQVFFAVVLCFFLPRVFYFFLLLV